MSTTRRKRILAGWTLLGGLWLPWSSVGKAQTVVRSFDGDSGPGLAVCQTGVTHCDRPELDVAVNGKQVVQVTWQNVRVYDYSGRLLRSTPMTEFIRQAGLNPIPPEHRKPAAPSVPGPFEPHVVFNEFIGRWIITVTGLNDCTLVSASSDAQGAWGGTYLSCAQGGPCLDYDPGLHIGYDKNGLYVCGAHMGDDNPNTQAGTSYDCFAVPPAQVRAIGQGKAPTHINRAHNMPIDIVPAIDHNRDKQPGAPALFMTKSCLRAKIGGCQRATNLSFDWLVNTFIWKGSTGTWNPGQQVVKTGVGSTRNIWLYNSPCCGETMSIPQAGSVVTLRAATSHRLMNLVQSGSHLYGALGSGPCTRDCGPQGTDSNNVMFWVDMDCSNPAACVVSRTEKISGAAFHAEFGTVGVDEAGNIGIVSVSATAGTNLSLLLWTRRKGDQAFQGPVTILAGTQPYTCLDATNNMTSIGGATGILTALDPLDGTKLWTTQQWANDATRCVWNTRIVEYQIAPPPGTGGKRR